MPRHDPLAVRNVSVRLPQDVFDSIVSIARVDEITMGEVIRRSVRQYAVSRKSEADWADKVLELQRQLESLLPPPIPASQGRNESA